MLEKVKKALEGRRAEWSSNRICQNKPVTMSLKEANKRSSDQTNYYLFEAASKGTKMTITMDYKMNKVLRAHRRESFRKAS